MNEWQPIETVPTDGRWVIVMSVHNKYAKGAVQYVDGQWLDLHDEHIYADGPIRNVMTHWMDFPSDPPSA